MAHVLCPALYSRMREVFGRVEIANQGEETVVRRNSSMAGLPWSNRPEAVLSGEYYRASCRNCGDTRCRLWVNYRFGEFSWLAHCFNEGCMGGLDGRSRRRELHEILTGTSRPVELAYAPGEVVGDVNAGPLPGTTFPGEAAPLTGLSVDNPSRQHLASRHLDPDEMSRQYGVAHCFSSEVRPAVGRLIIPIFMNGKMVGWQGRWPEDLNWKKSGTPKYYNLPHMPKRRMLYNFDIAKQYRTVVVTEGCTDAWSVGSNAVAIFGKSLSSGQRQLLHDHWSGGSIVILLDGEAKQEAVKMQEELAAIFKGQVLKVELPDNADPGSLSRQTIWNIINETAVRSGVRLDLNHYPA